MVAQRIALAAALGLLLVVPFSVAAVEVLAGTAIVAWIVHEWQTQGCRKGLRWPGALPLGLFVAWSFASALWSARPLGTLDGSFSKTLEYACVYGLVAQLTTERGWHRRAASMVAGACAVLLLDVVWQRWTGRDLLLGHAWVTYGRVTGPFTNPNNLGGCLAVMIPLLVAGWQPRRGLRYVLAFGAACVLWCTQSLSAGLGLVAASMYWCWPWRPCRMAAGVVAVALLGLGVWVMSAHQQPMPWLWHSLLHDAGVQDRAYMWQAGWRMFLAHPLIGHGANTFMSHYLDYWAGGEMQPRYAHNGYLQIAAELGVVGLGCFVWFVLAVIRHCRQAVRVAAGAEQRWLRGVLASVIAGLVTTLFDNTLYSLRLAVQFWVVLGMAAGAGTLFMRHPSRAGSVASR